MNRIIRADQRHHQDLGWLQTYWLFSFSDYHDPANVNFGRLRVFNDDVVAPGNGFPEHPHRDMEIITLVLSGAITHEDSTGRRETVGAGGVQVMTAGTGLRHSEFNRADGPLWLYQIWIYPDAKGLPPAYAQKQFDDQWVRNRLAPLASGQDKDGAVPIHADATVYRAVMDAGRDIRYAPAAGRKILIYATAGELAVNSEVLHEKDQARIDARDVLDIRAPRGADLILIDAAP